MKRNISWRREAGKMADGLELGNTGRAMFGPVTTASWSWNGWRRCVTATDLTSVSERCGAEDLRTSAAASVVRWQGAAVFYTNGSLLPDQLLGGSAVIQLPGPPGEESVVDGKSICLVGASSSLEVEVRALGLAADQVECLSGDGHVVLCSDSRSALEPYACPWTARDPTSPR